MREKTFENRLIAALRNRGAYAVHMDCYVPGFPDIFISDKGKITLAEVKLADRCSRLSSVFEASQPQFYLEQKKRGVDVWVAVFLSDTREWAILNGNDVAMEYASGHRDSTLMRLSWHDFGKLEDVVGFLLS